MSESRNEVLQRLAHNQHDFTELIGARFAINERLSTRVFLDRLDERNEHGDALPPEYSVRFETGSTPSFDLIQPQQIPALIDALTLMHREWLFDLNGS